MTEDAPERRITAIELQKRNPDRVNVSLDGVFAMGLPMSAVADLGLRIGRVLTPAEIELLKAMDDVAKATDSAIRLLTSRPRSVREIQERLRRKQYGDETIERVIERLRGWGYVDDEAFARYWVENRESNRPRGRRLIEQELRMKGIERESLAQAIDEAGIDERAGALEIARAKMRSYRGEEEIVARRRLGAFLARRGYGYDVVKPVLDELFGEREGDESID
jgi:regulatory protein